VRCGQCQHIFNALKQLTEVSPPSPATHEPSPSENIEPASDATVITTLALEATTLPLWEEHDPAIEITTAPEPDEVVLGKKTIDIELVPPAKEEVTEIAARAPAGTVSGKGLASEPKRGISGWVLAPLALLLLLTALGQMAYFLRTEIAVHYPPCKPWLDQGCVWLGCTVELPRHAELLSIEDSDLQDDPDHVGVLVLVSALYNRAPYQQAYPQLELTLTDTLDKPVLRRTFTPQEYLPKGTDTAIGIPGGGEVHSRLFLTVTGDKPAGYRLFVRY
jgi:hypothetical protein